MGSRWVFFYRILGIFIDSRFCGNKQGVVVLQGRLICRVVLYIFVVLCIIAFLVGGYWVQRQCWFFKDILFADGGEVVFFGGCIFWRLVFFGEGVQWLQFLVRFVLGLFFQVVYMVSWVVFWCVWWLGFVGVFGRCILFC